MTCVICTAPPPTCVNASNIPAGVKNKFTVLSTADSSLSLSSLPATTGSGGSYQMVPYWVPATNIPYGLPPIPALLFYYDSTTLQLTLPIQVSSGSKLPTVNSSLTSKIYKLVTNYNADTKTYSAPYFTLANLAPPCNIIDSWAFTPVPSGTSGNYYLQPAPIGCISQSGTVFHCTDTTVSVKVNTSNMTNISSPPVGLSVTAVDPTSYNSIIQDTQVRQNRYTFNLLRVLSWIQQ